MQNRKDIEELKEVGDVELANNDHLAEGGDYSPEKINNADPVVSSNFKLKNVEAEAEHSPRSSNQTMKKCFIGITIVGCLILVVIIIILAASQGGSKEITCPPYQYRDQDIEVGDIYMEGEGNLEDADRIQAEELGVCVMATCDFRTEIMIDGGKSCQKCEVGTTVNAMGTECVSGNCMQNQFLNQDGQCEECPLSYSNIAGECYQADRGKIDMIQVFETNPDFAHYSNVHRTTQNIAMFFDEKSENYRGPITRPFTEQGVPTDSPITNLITEAPITGRMFHINQIQEEPNSPYYMDVWFINSNMDTKVINKLNILKETNGTKCCWTDKETGQSLNKYFTGFARIIEYADYQRNGASPEYAFKMTEGQISHGQARGFARVISGFEGKMDFGFFKGSTRLQINEGASDKTEKFYMDQVTRFINDNQMVVFTKSYCPYSRALRNMLDANGLEGKYSVFEIDRELHGNEIHKALKEISGRLTIPNVYLNRENLGGDEEVEAMAEDGTLKRKLQDLGIYNTF